MDYAVLLSEEHPELPLAELEATLRADGIEFEIQEKEGKLVFLDGDEVEEVADRLALSFEISEVLHSFQPENYQKLATKNLEAEEPFSVRTARVDGTEAPEELEENVGRMIDRNSDVDVDLESPGEVFRAYLVNGEAHLSRLKADTDRGEFESRKNQHRPFSSPVTLHPRLARTLVNLSEVGRDGSLLDPFCGTGGILLEAGLIGCDLYGSDVQEEMVEGTRENLEAFNLEGDIREAEFSDAEAEFGRQFDAVVTDLPYGKASVTEGDPTEEFVETAPELTDGKVVFMSDREEIDGLEPEFEFYVHRSMTRYVYVME